VGNGNKWAGKDVVGDEQLSKAILDLAREDLLADKAAFDIAVAAVVRQIMAMPKNAREAWKSRLPTDSGPLIHRAAVTTRVPKAGIASMATVLGNGEQSFTVAAVAHAVEEMVALFVRSQPDRALLLANSNVGGSLTGNAVNGILVLANGVGNPRVPEHSRNDILALYLPADASLVSAGGEDLTFLDNFLERLASYLPAESIPTAVVREELPPGKTLVGGIPGYDRVSLSGNRIEGENNVLVARSVSLQGNYFTASQHLGYLLVEQGTFVGNIGQPKAVLETSAAKQCGGKLCGDGTNTLFLNAI
jgi:hypothetical protein